MSIVQRVMDVLLNPKATWPTIDAESASVQSVYVPYVVALAAISAVAGFIGTSIVGVGGFGLSYRVPVISGLLNMVVGFVLALVMVFVMALIADALAPTFGGQKNQVSALKLIGYGSTAGFLGGVFSIIPAASLLGLLAALYSTTSLEGLGHPFSRLAPRLAHFQVQHTAVGGIYVASGVYDPAKH